MRYRLPKGCSAVSFDGKTATLAADGTVELDARAAAALQPHGLVPVPVRKADAPASDRRSTR